MGQGSQDHGDLMGRRDKIDIMTTLRLEAQHNCGQILYFNLFSFPTMADFPILTENTKEIAVAEKDSPRAMLPDQRVFFTEVGSKTGDSRFVTHTAKTNFPVAAIHMALMGADLAGEHNIVGRIDPLLQKASTVDF
jgi:hypothetical protein